MFKVYGPMLAIREKIIKIQKFKLLRTDIEGRTTHTCVMKFVCQNMKVGKR